MAKVDQWLVDKWLNDFKLKKALEVKDTMLSESLKRLSKKEVDEITQIGIDKSNALIEDEIKETEGTISNENLWLKGSSTKEEEELHAENIATLSAYIEKLKELKDE